MKALLATCVAVLLLAGCSSDSAHAPKPQPKPRPELDLAHPVAGPIGVGEHLKSELRTHNDDAKTRRTQMDEIFDKK